MSRKKSSRKYLLTINNPLEQSADYSHEGLKNRIASLPQVLYWCMCDEVGENGTPHTHLYFATKNQVEWDRVFGLFYGSHIDAAFGTHRENRDYIRKEGKHLESEKKATNLPDTFEESGELPPENARKGQTDEIYAMIKEGATVDDVIEAYPSAMYHQNQLEQMRQRIIAKQYQFENRDVSVTYIWGETGTGKTRGVIETHGIGNIYRMTNYDHPFDQYNGEPVIVFEEFRSSLKIGDMLNYLDIYPLQLPCRYNNKWACFTTVYLISNIPLEEQYCNIQQEEPETWKAFKRRIHEIEEYCQAEQQEIPEDDDNLDGLPF